MTTVDLPSIHYRWDVDKTYIRTEFDSMRDLIRMWRQRPEEKEHIPGAPALLRELLATQGGTRHVSFISGSPQQMRSVLLRRFELDGITPDALILKPNLQNILQLKLRDVRNQVGYKLSALLQLRTPGDSEFLFGDDSEQDALIYSLYADLLTGVIGPDLLQEFLGIAGLYPAAIERIVTQYLALAPQSGKVERIIIHLDRRSPLTRFHAYGWRVVPVYNYFQAALVLFAMDQLSSSATLRVLAAMRSEGYSPIRIANSLEDLVRRQYVEPTILDALRESLETTPPISEHRFLREAFTHVRLPSHAPIDAHWRHQDTPDYRQIFETQRYHRSTASRPGRPWLMES